MSTKLKPLGARVLLRKYEQEQTTSSGIVLPKSAVVADTRYEVVKVGPDCESGVKAGSTVVIPQCAGTVVGEYTILEETSILAEYE